MNAIRRNLVIEICVLSHRSVKFAFSPENSPKPTNKQLLQQARLTAGLRDLQTPLAHPVAAAAARLGTVLVVAAIQGDAHIHLKPLLEIRGVIRRTNLLGVDFDDKQPEHKSRRPSRARSLPGAPFDMGCLAGRCNSPWRFGKVRIVPARAYAVRNVEPVSTARKPLPDYRRDRSFENRCLTYPPALSRDNSSGIETLATPHLWSAMPYGMISSSS